jgi:hypothetical protein
VTPPPTRLGDGTRLSLIRQSPLSLSAEKTSRERSKKFGELNIDPTGTRHLAIGNVLDYLLRFLIRTTSRLREPRAIAKRLPSGFSAN